MRPYFRLILLLIVPFAYVCLAIYGSDLRGPFYMISRVDPDYAYLFNSLNIAKSRVVGHADHPGLTLQLFGGLMLRLREIFTSFPGSLQAEVAAAPEASLRFLQTTTAILSGVGLWLGGMLVSRTDLFRGIILQLGVLSFSSVILVEATRFRPEALIVGLGAVFLGYCWRCFDEDATDRDWGVTAVILGFLGGLLFMTKLTALPFLILPLYLVRQSFYRVELYVAAMVGTIVLLFAYPAANPGEFLGFSENLVAQRGYNRAEEGLDAKWSDRLVFLASVAKQNLPATLFFFGAAIAGLALRRMFSLALLAVMVFQAILFLNSPGALHYLLPGFMVIGTSVLALMRPRYLTGITATALVFFFYLNGAEALRSFREDGAEARSYHEVLARYPRVQRVGLYVCSDPDFALHFGSFFGRHYFRDTIFGPDRKFYQYNVWSNAFQNPWDGEVPFGEILSSSNGRVLITGPSTLPDALWQPAPSSQRDKSGFDEIAGTPARVSLVYRSPKHSVLLVEAVANPG